jgi:hypothetical protein
MSIIGSHWYRYPRIIVLWHPSIREPVYSCGTMIDLDLTVKRRDPNAPSALRLMMFGARAATVTGARGMALPRLSVD